MKLISINRQLSDKRNVAFRTEPQIDVPVFDQIRRLLQQSPTLRGVGLELKDGCLVVTASAFTPELAKNVNELLNAAENAVRQIQEDVRKRAEQEQAEKLHAIQSASTVFGVPVE
jgi:ssDNA-binding replication factor A large subunit